MISSAQQLDALVRDGVLSPFDRQFAASMVRLAGETRPELELATALTSRAVARGHVCLSLRSIPEIVGHHLAESGPIDWPGMLSDSPMVTTRWQPHGSQPLVFAAPDRLYLARYFDHETAVAHALRRRAQARPPAADAEALASGLAVLFPDGQRDASRRAAELACTRRLLILAGGPGTGKTTTVVRLLATMMQASSPRPRSVALLAPTGKAVARLEAAVRAGEHRLHTEGLPSRALPLRSATIHRALGPRGDLALDFRHNRENPLPDDVVIVDEASMIDLALTRRLLDAVADDTTLVMLGDADQLASVEAGAVFGDICAAGRQLVGRTGTVGDCFTELTHSHRFDPSSGIGALAAAIRRGDPEAAMVVLADGDSDAVLWHPSSGPGLPRSLVEQASENYRASSSAQALRQLDAFRVLAPLRGGPRGVDAINAAIQRHLGPQPAGHPILVTRNDVTLGLFNGDIGVETEEDSRRVVYFPAAQVGQAPRRIAASRLPAYEPVFAMTVHKSQGSEFDDVAIVLPQEDTPLLTRELLYTAVTRARRRVTVVGTAATIAASIGRTVSRATGLRDRLLDATRPGPSPG
ncbi:MAG: exodeoxyribonuclease V subunit alpha [Myxococcales bacterium FL481]|nr:MAG: exodeoxyribonuclease V subunit alpha [Myxococcales bacterium FL481]